MEERLRAGFEAFLRHDLDALRDLLAPDVTWDHWDPGPWDCHGRDAVLARMQERMDQGFTGELTEVSCAGDKAVVLIDGNLWGVCLTVTLRDGVIAHLRDHTSPQEARIDAGLAEHVPPAPPGPGHDRVHRLVPFVHVTDVEASAAFYAHLGFEMRDRLRADWCFLESPGGAQLMLARAEEPIDRDAQAVLFYLYTRDLAGLRERLVAAGLRPGPIHDGAPGPTYELRIADPDGYTLMVAQLQSLD